MDLVHGLILGSLGIILTIIGFGIALYFGSREDKEVKYEDLTSVQKSLRDIFDRKK